MRDVRRSELSPPSFFIVWFRATILQMQVSHLFLCFLPDLLFDPEDGGHMFLWSVGHFPTYMGLQPCMVTVVRATMRRLFSDFKNHNFSIIPPCFRGTCKCAPSLDLLVAFLFLYDSSRANVLLLRISLNFRALTPFWKFNIIYYNDILTDFSRCINHCHISFYSIQICN